MDKPFSARFKMNSKILAIIFICYKHKLPLAFMLSFYEMYGDNSFFAFKAMACIKRIPLNDNTFTKILQESRLLYKEILRGVSELIDDKNCKPQINLDLFSPEYAKFINEYLLHNISNIYSTYVELKMNCQDIYEELVP